MASGSSAGSLSSPEAPAGRSLKRPRKSDADSEVMEEVAELLDGEEKANGGAHHEGNGIGWRTVKVQYDAGRLRRKRRAMILLGLASTATSLSINFLSTRVTAFPLAGLPLATSLAAVVATKAAASCRGVRIEGGGEGWRERMRTEGPVVAAGVLALTCRASAAGWAGIAVPQAVEVRPCSRETSLHLLIMCLQVFVAPMLLVLLPTFGLDSAGFPSPRPYIAACLLSLAVALALVPQRTNIPAIVVSILSAASQTLYLLLLKRWQSTRQSTSPLSAVHRWAPLAFFFSLIPFFFRKFDLDLHRPFRSVFEAIKAPGLGGWSAILVFAITKLMETFGELLAIESLDGPVPMALLAPIRNLGCLGFATPLGLFVGLSNVVQLVFVYFFSLIGISTADAEVREALRPLEDDDDDVGDNRFAAIAKQAQAPLQKPRRPSVSHQADYVEPPLPPSRRRLICALALVPLAIWSVLNVYTAWVTPRPTFDVVFTHFNEPIDDFVGVIKHVKGVSVLQEVTVRIIIYVKGDTTNLQEMMDATGADEVVRRPNVGREGAAYLSHILRHYPYGDLRSEPLTSPLRQLALTTEFQARVAGERLVKSDVRGLADHTLFMQPHFAWHWLAIPRLDMFDMDRTGFLSLGPYVDSDCGEDGRGKGNYERMKDIYVIFRETVCLLCRILT